MRFVDPNNGRVIPVTTGPATVNRIAPALQGLQHPLYMVARRTEFQKSVIVLEITRGFPVAGGGDLAFQYLNFNPSKNQVGHECTLRDLERSGLQGLSFVYAMVMPGVLVPVGMPWSIILERLFEPGPEIASYDLVAVNFNFMRSRFQMERPPPLPTLPSGAHLIDDRVTPVLRLDPDGIVLRFSLEFGVVCASMSRVESGGCIASEECTMGCMDALEISRLESTLYNFARPLVCSRHIYPTTYLVI